jgi:hypothetical protein
VLDATCTRSEEETMRIKTVGTPLALLLGMTLALPQPLALAGGDDHHSARGKRLTSRIDYTLVPVPRPMDDQGRVLVWEATIQGDINGTMKWWFEQPPPAVQPPFPGGRVAYYAARWEIWDEWGDRLLLAGESAGKTVFPAEAGATGIWDGHGVVTEVRRAYASLKGRSIYETGPVITPETPGPLFGTGLFVIH